MNSVEISYEKRVKVESQPTSIHCGATPVLSEKFNIKIENENNIGNTMTIVFTSFLYNSLWGLSNIKLLSACTHFSSYDPLTQTCSLCDTDSYLVHLPAGERYCEKCPNLCRTCTSKSNCTTCFEGAFLDKKGSCSFGSNFKAQELRLESNPTSCLEYSYYESSSEQVVAFPELRNENNELYDEIQLNFRVIYAPSDWGAAGADRISIKINKVEAFSLSSGNLTSRGTISCGGRSVGVMEFLTHKKIHNDNKVTISFEYSGKNKQLKFGVSHFLVKSIKKNLVLNETAKEPSPDSPNNTTPLLPSPLNSASSTSPDYSTRLPALHEPKNTNSSVAQR